MDVSCPFLGYMTYQFTESQVPIGGREGPVALGRRPPPVMHVDVVVAVAEHAVSFVQLVVVVHVARVVCPGLAVAQDVVISQELTVEEEQLEIDFEVEVVVVVGSPPWYPGGKQRNSGGRMQGIHKGMGGLIQGMRVPLEVSVVVVPGNVVGWPFDPVKVVGGTVMTVVMSEELGIVERVSVLPGCRVIVRPSVVRVVADVT